MSNDTNNQLYTLLESIQLESFYGTLRDKLQITRIAHFDHVKPKDLEQVGMAKPAIRRLLDTVEKRKTLLARPRPPPPPPVSTNHLSQTSSSLNSTINQKNTNAKSDSFLSKVSKTT
jgi:hypothetical protein